MTITYYYLISKERLQKLKETNISLTIARNIVTTVGIANQTQHAYSSISSHCDQIIICNTKLIWFRLIFTLLVLSMVYTVNDSVIPASKVFDWKVLKDL